MEIRNGYAWPPVVMGTTRKVLKDWLSSSGETTAYGRVFLISWP